MGIGESEWGLFNSLIKNFGVPEVNAYLFSAAPAEVRALFHRLSGDALRDAFHAYQIMIVPDVESERHAQVLRGFISSGCQNGAPWANEDSVQVIHREYVDSIDWGSGFGDPP